MISLNNVVIDLDYLPRQIATRHAPWAGEELVVELEKCDLRG
jgi:hypothetical protein